MYDEYFRQLEEAGKIRNLKERSISCYKTYVSYFPNYVGKEPSSLTCQDVRDSFPQSLRLMRCTGSWRPRTT